MDEPVDLELISTFDAVMPVAGVAADDSILQRVLTEFTRQSAVLEEQAIATARAMTMGTVDSPPPGITLWDDSVVLLQTMLHEMAYSRFVCEEEKRIAEARAESLLLSHLTLDQQDTWRRSGYVRVEVTSPEAPEYDGLYHIHRFYKTGRFINGRRTHTYCLQAARHDLDYHSIGVVPDVDTVLAEVLLLRFNPAAYHAQANVLWSAEYEERMFGTTFDGVVQAIENVAEALANFGRAIRAIAETLSDFAIVVQTQVRVIPPGRTWPNWNAIAEERNRGRMEVYRVGRGPPTPIIHLET